MIIPVIFIFFILQSPEISQPNIPNIVGKWRLESIEGQPPVPKKQYWNFLEDGRVLVRGPLEKEADYSYEINKDVIVINMPDPTPFQFSLEEDKLKLGLNGTYIHFVLESSNPDIESIYDSEDLWTHIWFNQCRIHFPKDWRINLNQKENDIHLSLSGGDKGSLVFISSKTSNPKTLKDFVLEFLDNEIPLIQDKKVVETELDFFGKNQTSPCVQVFGLIHNTDFVLKATSIGCDNENCYFLMVITGSRKDIVDFALKRSLFRAK